MSKPKRIYKYEPFNSRSLENLKAQSIYFGSPLAFNDPFDCAFTPGTRPLTDADLARVKKYYLEQEELPSRARDELEAASSDGLRVMFERAGRGALDHAIQDFLKRRGVSCFSEKSDDLLMWAHYAGSHKGFCLEFDTAYAPFDNMYKVRYETEVPQIDLVPMLMDDHDQVMELFSTKAKAWEYEAEWRVIHAEAGTMYCYPAQSLTGVYFGPQMSDTAIEIICLVLQGQTDHVRFWRGSRSTTTFKVDFESFIYTSHLDAKRKGLI